MKTGQPNHTWYPYASRSFLLSHANVLILKKPRNKDYRSNVQSTGVPRVKYFCFYFHLLIFLGCFCHLSPISSDDVELKDPAPLGPAPKTLKQVPAPLGPALQ